MAALGNVLALSGATTRDATPGQEYKMLVIELPATVDDTDTFTLDLTRYGCTRLSAVWGFDHTTDGSVVVAAAPTTAVAANVLTVTIGGSTDNLVRVIVLMCR